MGSTLLCIKTIGKTGLFKHDGSSVEFKFHGAGCDFVIVDTGLNIKYDFAPLDNHFIKISVWKFFNYTKSSKNFSHLTEEELKTLFEKSIRQHQFGYYMFEKEFI